MGVPQWRRRSALHSHSSGTAPPSSLGYMRYGPATMLPPLRRVAVLGAGVMGAGIAAHCANAGLPVLLLDIVPVQPLLDKLVKAKPAAFMHPRNARLIETGHLEHDLAR